MKMYPISNTTNIVDMIIFRNNLLFITDDRKLYANSQEILTLMHRPIGIIVENSDILIFYDNGIVITYDMEFIPYYKISLGKNIKKVQVRNRDVYLLGECTIYKSTLDKIYKRPNEFSGMENTNKILNQHNNILDDYDLRDKVYPQIFTKREYLYFCDEHGKVYMHDRDIILLYDHRERVIQVEAANNTLYTLSPSILIIYNVQQRIIKQKIKCTDAVGLVAHKYIYFSRYILKLCTEEIIEVPPVIRKIQELKNDLYIITDKSVFMIQKM